MFLPETVASCRSRDTALELYRDPDAGASANSTVRVASNPTPEDARRRTRELLWVWVAAVVGWGTGMGNGGMGCSREVTAPRGRDRGFLLDPDRLDRDPQLLEPLCA